MTGWRMAFPSSSSRVVQAIGLLVILMGLVPVVWTFVYFVRAGSTPIPGAVQSSGVLGWSRRVHRVHAHAVSAAAGFLKRIQQKSSPTAMW